MIRWAIAFAILALIAGVLGFGGRAGDFAGIAKILLFVFLVLVVISLIVGRGRRPGRISPGEADHPEVHHAIWMTTPGIIGSPTTRASVASTRAGQWPARSRAILAST